jgi:UDP-N-acetylmuramoyl-L-alanyl-D-glutamate--2,6-diaminopimelate ligase
MGNIAKKYCDRVILTNEDPYDEDPMAIIDEIAGNNKGVEKVVDRRQAIRDALKGAKAGDAVLVTGKGCEDSMCLADGKKIPWNDKAVILEEMAKIK